jgi:two-component system, OmpR family, response regulator ResD
VLRRAPSHLGVLPLDITVGDMTVSTAARSVTIKGEPISLTNREFDLLIFPHPHRHRVLPRGIAETDVALGLW